MHTNSYPAKVSGITSKIMDKIIVATGAISLVWILVFLLVAMIDK